MEKRKGMGLTKPTVRWFPCGLERKNALTTSPKQVPHVGKSASPKQVVPVVQDAYTRITSHGSGHVTTWAGNNVSCSFFVGHPQKASLQLFQVGVVI